MEDPSSVPCSVATAQLKMAEPAEPSHFEPSWAKNQLMTKTGSAWAHEPAELGWAMAWLGHDPIRQVAQAQLAHWQFDRQLPSKPWADSSWL